jgi:hypothetical protein
VVVVVAPPSPPVKFQKEMRPVSLEIPEPDATGYQNLMRQNTKLTMTRSDKLSVGKDEVMEYALSHTLCPALIAGHSPNRAEVEGLLRVR